MDEIGDLVTALPVFYNRHQWYPNAQQTLVCKSFNNTFFKHLDYVSCVNDFNEVANKTYDLVIDLRGTTETLQYCLSKRPHYRLDRGSIRLLNKFNGGQKNEIDTNIQIIEPLQKKSPDLSNEIKLSEKERRTVSDYLALQGIDKYIIMHLGCTR